MPAILEILGQQLGGNTMRMLGDQVGADVGTTRRAVQAALPVLIGGLAHRANASEQGARALVQALERDHDGSLLDNLDDVLQRSAKGGGTLRDAGSPQPGGISIARPTVDGPGILDHLFGDKRSEIELGISRASTLDARKTAKLMEVLAPIVMSALGYLRVQRSLDADQLASLLNKERAGVERETSGTRNGDLVKFFEMDGDGRVADEVATVSGRFATSSTLGELFG